MNKKNKNSVSIITLFGSIIIAIIIFVILINVQDSMVKDIETTKIVVAKKDIPKNVEIKVADFKEYFEEKDIPNYNIISDTYKSLDELKKDVSEIYISEDISKNEQIQSKQITTENTSVKDIVEPIEIGFDVGSFDYGVGGCIRTGDLIDIYVVNGATGVEECVGTDIYVSRAMDNTGKEITNEDKTSLAVAYNVIIETSDVESFVQKLEKGTVRVAKKNDIS